MSNPSEAYHPILTRFIDTQIEAIKTEPHSRDRDSWMPSQDTCNAILQCFACFAEILAASNHNHHEVNHYNRQTGFINNNTTYNTYQGETEAGRRAKEEEREFQVNVAAGVGGAIAAGAGAHYSAQYINKVIDLNERIDAIKDFEYSLNGSAAANLNDDEIGAFKNAASSRKQALELEQDYMIAELALIIVGCVAAIFVFVAAIAALPELLIGAGIIFGLACFGMIFTLAFESGDHRSTRHNQDAQELLLGLQDGKYRPQEPGKKGAELPSEPLKIFQGGFTCSAELTPVKQVSEYVPPIPIYATPAFPSAPPMEISDYSRDIDFFNSLSPFHIPITPLVDARMAENLYDELKGDHKRIDPETKMHLTLSICHFYYIQNDKDKIMEILAQPWMDPPVKEQITNFVTAANI